MMMMLLLMVVKTIMIMMMRWRIRASDDNIDDYKACELMTLRTLLRCHPGEDLEDRLVGQLRVE